ncbi:hypothetical protein Golomagni_01239 [Golovinomyces magnicellulatus]|nr:hypothetical protein Golomagni_01239 [Golovinomyces magnicellulatus]
MKSHHLAQSIFQDVCHNLDTLCGVQKDPIVLKDPSQLYRVYLNKADLFVRFVDQLAFSRVSGSNQMIIQTFKDWSIIGDQYCCVLLQHSSIIARVLPYEIALMMKDLCLAQANVFDGIRILYPNNQEMESRVIDILNWCEECLVKYGNVGYEILKGIESITKAFIIEKEDSIFSGDGALQRLTKILRQKEFDLNPEVIDYSIFGLQKITGHPLINPSVGGTSAAKLASEPKSTTYLNAKILRNNWCRLYLEGFILKTNRWPDLHFPMEHRQGNRLFQLYSLRERNITKSDYNLSDWDHVRFKKHVEFDYHDNYLELMDDKSISYYLSDFRATWRRDIQPKSHRR